MSPNDKSQNKIPYWSWRDITNKDLKTNYSILRFHEDVTWQYVVEFDTTEIW